MPKVNWTGHELITGFTDFYQEVTLIKEAIALGRLPLLLGKTDADSPADLTALVSARLAEQLQHQLLTLKAEATTELRRVYDMAHYAMAALADEIFLLEIQWDGQQHWGDYLLEYNLFKRRQAGRQFFELIDWLLRQRQGHGQLMELATLYLLALQLGFKGEYRGHKGQTVLADYRRKLMLFITARNPNLGDNHPMFPMAYAYPLSSKDDRRLAPLRPWMLTALGLGVLYLALSSALWLKLTEPVNTLLNALLTTLGGAS
ncbi:MAG: DotU family type IV/VI secretion system protein [Pseudomonadota bacterium]|uniref:Type VI secretion system protein ImpK n=1 Tax=Gallaecimonas pentaromativorans TaxID=584787 RepID=A0A3N1PF39_9GAMM|nr:DotU family type IV/VI secretion system protein [Gallaecimonas pentaromativorans]MED5523371.1 DotU family type IV/VI secretion system protein [Pseudomonadota bacterium]ROQ30564.1 type VI secretion system protein ImpK [Gallaecimonas pentaromativorans]